MIKPNQTDHTLQTDQGDQTDRIREGWSENCQTCKIANLQFWSVSEWVTIISTRDASASEKESLIHKKKEKNISKRENSKYLSNLNHNTPIAHYKETSEEGSDKIFNEYKRTSHSTGVCAGVRRTLYAWNWLQLEPLGFPDELRQRQPPPQKRSQPPFCDCRLLWEDFLGVERKSVDNVFFLPPAPSDPWPSSKPSPYE